MFLLLNKIDLLRDKKKLLPIIEEYRKLHDFREVIPMSGLKKEGLDVLLDAIVNALPAGPAYFPEDQITDQPARFMAAEIIREQVLLNTKEEVPHATTVIVEQFEEGERLARIAAAIYCERDGQKAILVGKGGQMLKKIGTAARLQDRAHVRDEGFSRTFREGAAGMAGFARFRGRTGLAAATGGTGFSSRPNGTWTLRMGLSQ